MFGWSAVALTAIYRLPQIAHTINQKRVDDLSYSSLVLQLLVSLLYLVHGHEIGDAVTVASGSVASIQALCIILLYHIYRTGASGDDDDDDENDESSNGYQSRAVDDVVNRALD